VSVQSDSEEASKGLRGKREEERARMGETGERESEREYGRLARGRGASGSEEAQARG
jgi:hypothetical protein